MSVGFPRLQEVEWSEEGRAAYHPLLYWFNKCWKLLLYWGDVLMFLIHEATLDLNHKSCIKQGNLPLLQFSCSKANSAAFKVNTSRPKSPCKSPLFLASFITRHAGSS